MRRGQRRGRNLLAAMLLGLAAATAAAQSWPAKPMRLIVPFPPGGGTDILARLLSTHLSEANHWQIVIDNKPGAGGTLAIADAVKASPAGYDFVFGQKDNLVIGRWLYPGLRWDPVDDLTPIAHLAYSPVLISTAADSPYQTLADVIDAARRNPGSISYGSPGNGTSIHLATYLLEKTAGVSFNHIPYRGSSPALLDVLAGNIDLQVSSIPSVLGQIRAGRLRPLAVTSAQRSASLPDVPTVAESGIENAGDFDVTTWYGVLAPKGIAEQVQQTMHARINALLADEKVRQSILAQGAQPHPMTQQAFHDLLKSDYSTWQTIVQESGVRID